MLAACATTRIEPSAPRAPNAAPAAAASIPSAAVTPQGVLVDGAMSMLGHPYRFGGAAPGGFDCSGLVLYAAARAGIPLPRTAHEQLHAGTPIRRSELRTGDLVFMHLAHKQLHVGIVIDGDRFIHAPAAGGVVRIDSLNSMPYARGFVSARRIVPAP